MADSSPSPERTRHADADDPSGSPTHLTGPIDPTVVPAEVSPFTGTPAPTELVSRTLGQYELLELLGQGGMGAVYKARHKKLDKLVALKLLPSDLMRTTQAVARFEREMRAVGKIDHPNIVRAMDAGDVNGTHYLAMELVEGKDLTKLVKERGPLSVKDACKAIRQAALGLEAAHKGGLVHRDIKPSNLLLAKTGQIKILDLGLARIGNENVPHEGITSSGQVLGTPDFMAPEQWEDTHTADARTDLYALGCTLFYLLVGRAPFATDDYRSVLKKMAAHVNAPIPDLKGVRANVPAGVDAIYQRLMAKRPEDRFASAAELAAALAPYATSKTVDSTIVPADVSQSAEQPMAATTLLPSCSAEGGSTATAVTSVSAEHSAPPRKPGYKRWLAAGGAAALVLLGVIVIVITNRDGSKTKIEVPGDPQQIDISQDGKSLVKVSTPTNAPAKASWQGWPADAPKPAIAPFDAEQAKRHQEDWAAYLKVPVEYTNSIGMKFRLIPPGEFAMGGTPAEIEAGLKFVSPDDFELRAFMKSAGPQHQVVLSQPFYLGSHEVTQSQYKQVMGHNPSHFAPTNDGREAVTGIDTSSHPVEMVDWNDAAEFCNTLCVQEQFKPFYFRSAETVTLLVGSGYRLSTEAEWEFSCRAGTTTKYWSGTEDDDSLQTAWSQGNNTNRTHRVGELRGNPFGLYDIHGNVWEWVQDWWDPNYYAQFQGKSATNPIGPSTSGVKRSMRGGSWANATTDYRASFRLAGVPDYRLNTIGFRVALPVDAVRQALKVTGLSTTPSAPASANNGWPADAPNPAIAPFDTRQARHHQEEWAKYLQTEVEHTNSIGMKFVLIPPGEFMMGSTAAEIEAAVKDINPNVNHWQECVKSEAPQHRVILTQPVYLSVNEVTQAEYEKVMGTNPSHFASLGLGKEAVAGIETTNHPVETVTWNDAAEFCAKLSQQEKFKPFYFREGEIIIPLDGTGYRLPSEAEWEFACRAGTITRYWFGDKNEDLMRAGWFNGNAGERPHASRELKANPFGLYDIHGNVWEWVQDGWDATWYTQFQKQPAINPNTPFSENSQRVIRGGSWHDIASGCRSSTRVANDPSNRHGHFGFRVSLVAVGPRVSRP